MLKLSSAVQVVPLAGRVIFVREQAVLEIKCEPEVNSLLSGLGIHESLQQVCKGLGKKHAASLLKELALANMLSFEETTWKDDVSARNEGWLALHTSRPVRAFDELKSKRVAIIGIGGIGSVVAQHLCGSGIKNFFLADPDHVASDNLNRQYMHTGMIGKSKVESASYWIKRTRPDAEVSTIESAIRSRESLQHIIDWSPDIVILAADQPRDLSSRLGMVLDKECIVWVTSGVSGDRGFWGPIVIPDVTACGRCSESLVLENVPDQIAPALNQCQPVKGSSGPVNSVIASFLSRDVVMYLAGVGKPSSLGARVILGMDGLPKADCLNMNRCDCW